jgi:prophage regulatory protein
MSEPEIPNDVACRPTRLLRLPEVMHRVGLRRSAIYQRMSEGRFPKSRLLGTRCTVWVESEVEQWIAAYATGNENGC